MELSAGVESANARSSVLDDQVSPKLIPRVSISNIKSPSKRHMVSKPFEGCHQASNMLGFLPELKQLVSFFNIHFYYQKSISSQEQQLKMRYTKLHQTLITLEQKPTKVGPLGGHHGQGARPRVSSMSQSTTTPPQENCALEQQVQHTVELFELIQETIGRTDLPSNILKGTLRTVSKLFEYKRSLVILLQKSAEQEESRNRFKPGPFLKTLFECQFDTHDTYQEEVILLTIQKITIQMSKHFSDMMSENELFKNCIYFFRVLKKRAINDHQITSLHMQEGTKQNMNKHFIILMQKEDQPQQVTTTFESTNADKYRKLKRKIFHMFTRKALKNIKKLEDATKNQVPPSDVAVTTEYVSFIVKAFSEGFNAMARAQGAQSNAELKSFILEEKEILLQVLCRAGEFQSIIIRNQAQLLFCQILTKVLELAIPFREEIEVLYTKLLLKPLEQLDQKITAQSLARLSPTKGQQAAQASGVAADKDSKDRMQMTTTTEQSAGEVSFLSDTEDNPETQDSSQTVAASQYDPSVATQGFELEVCLNLLVETLLGLQPDQLAQLFLVYDCQPLSQNLIRRSLHLILKHSQIQGNQTDLTRCYMAIGLIMKSLLRYNVQDKTDSAEQGSGGLRGMQSINDMLNLKNKAASIGKKANMKPKAFFQAIEQNFEGLTQDQTCKLAAKVLLYSRRVSLDKIAEIVGGKDDRAKQVLEEYLERQDYADCNIEKSMRSFLQTFRMAGVDSQVVFNILEKFGDKYFEKDHTKLFTSGSEAYNFAYLIIVLQTCQHNSAIKEKTGLDRFFSQAKEMVPESYDNLPEGFTEAIFHRITQQEIKAPVTRDLIGGDYEQVVGLSEIQFRLVTALKDQNQPSEQKGQLSESDFLSTADLREKQLFDMNNKILGVAPDSLQLSALRQIVNILTAKFCKIRSSAGDSRFNQMRTLELTKGLIQANAHFKNNDWVDRLFLDLDKQVESFCRISKLEDERKNAVRADLQNLYWDNFKILKLAVGYTPKMAPMMSWNSIHYQSFNAVEVKIRNKFNKDIPQPGLTTLNPKDRKKVEKIEASRQQQQQPQQADSPSQGQVSSTTVISSSAPLKAAAATSPDPKREMMQQPQPTTPRQGSGIFNMVYNYFTPVPSEAEEEAKKREYIMSGQNQIDLLKNQLDEFNRHSKTEVFESQGPENVSDSYFFDFLTNKGIDVSEALKQIAQFVHENMSSRQATLCLSYLYQVYLDSETSQDVETSMQVQSTILLISQGLVHQFTRPQLSELRTSRQNSSSNIPLTTQEDQDSLSDSFDQYSQKSDSTDQTAGGSNAGGADNGVQSLAKLTLKEPRKNQFEKEIAKLVNKHLVLELYFIVVGNYISKEELGVADQQHTDTRPTANELIKDVQKTLVSLSEDELTREDFEQAFLYEKVAGFIKPALRQQPVAKKVAPGVFEDVEDDEGTQKPNSEESKTASSASLPAAINPTENQVEVLPMREYPKIGKFLRLLIILMLQVNSKVCNKDQMQVSVIRLLRAISSMFVVQETIPYDQINLCLDVVNKNCAEFKQFHELSIQSLEGLLGICQTIFTLLERGSDGGEQKLFQQGQFDLWFKTMNVLISKILLSPYIEVFKSIQERTCTLVKIQILTFQFQPLTDGQNTSLRNYTKVIFEELVFTLNIAALETQREWFRHQVQSKAWTVAYTNEWEDPHEGFAQLCQLCANTLTDVFIQYAQSQAQEKEQSAESYSQFTLLWNKFMLVLLNYADATESLLLENSEVYSSVQPLQQSIQDNISRVMEFLISQKLLLQSSSDESDAIANAKVKLYEKTKQSLKLFWQEVKTAD